MRRLLLSGIAAVAAFAATPVPSAAPVPRHRAAPARRVTASAPQLTPARYRVAVAPVQDCAAFFARAGRLPDARPLLRTLFVDGVPQKSAIETSDQFVGRVVQRLFTRLGDPSRLHTSLPIDEAARYDADGGRLIVDLPRPFEAVLDSWSRSETPAKGGASQQVTSELRAGFEFAPGTLPHPIAVPMTPDQAMRFRSGGGRLQILSLLEDYGTDAAPLAPAASGGPARTSYRLVRLKPKCAILTNAGVPVGGWQFDGWAGAAPAG